MSWTHLLCIPTLLCGVWQAAGSPTAAQQSHTQHEQCMQPLQRKRDVKSTAWGDFQKKPKKTNVICNTVWFQFHNFPKLSLNCQEQNIKALCSLPEHQSHKHLENSWWSLLSSLERCLLKCQTSSEDVHTFVWHIQVIFLPHHSILAQYWSPSLQSTPLHPELTNWQSNWFSFQISKQVCQGSQKEI